MVSYTCRCVCGERCGVCDGALDVRYIQCSMHVSVLRGVGAYGRLEWSDR